MPYATLPTKAAGAVVTLSDYNTIRTDFMVGAPDIFTAKGDLAVAMEAETATRLPIGNDDDTLIAEALQLGGMAWQIQPAARVYNSADLAWSTYSWQTVTYDTTAFDTNGMYAGSTPSRLTIPTGGDGLYVIGANIKFPLSTYDYSFSAYSSVLGIRILLNGSTILAQNGLFRTRNASSVSGVCELLTLYPLVAGDYIEVQRYASYPYGILYAAEYSPTFWAIWQRRA